jgi:hypothetical protein
MCGEVRRYSVCALLWRHNTLRAPPEMNRDMSSCRGQGEGGQQLPHKRRRAPTASEGPVMAMVGGFR